MSNPINKVAIITGAAQGIGRAIAKALIEQNNQVVLNDVNANLAVKTMAELNDLNGGKCVVHVGDASKMSVVKEMIEVAITEFGQLDIAIANAGITMFKDFWNFELPDFQRIMQVNLEGSFLLTQLAAQQMRLQQTGGRILLLSSVVGQRAFPYATAYAMSKAALSMMARQLVVELSPHQIQINAVAPGATLTERTLESDSNYETEWQNYTPNQRVAYPEDIANVALFLLSDAAKHINGQTITVDGGWTGLGAHPPMEAED